jgi:RNA polymerase sigma-70 factor (sigma-E family)
VTVDAFAEFVASSYRALVRSAYLLVNDAGHAEDLVQTALISTMRAWPRLAADEAAYAYTRTTMVRLAGKWARRRWRGEIPTASPTERADQPADTVADDALDLRDVLAQLPWEQRAVLVLRYLDDLSEGETARLLGCSIGTVKSRASRALAALRRAGVPGTLTEVSDA